MKEKEQKNKKDETLYFCKAIDKIDESMDYNEYSEVNTSDFFKNSIYKAKDEIDKMVSSPIMTNYRKFKNKNNISLSPKRRKNLIFKKIKFLNKLNKNRGSINKFNSNSIKEKLYKMKNKNLKAFYKDQIEKQKLNINSQNLLPKIISSSKTIEVNPNNKINNSQKIKLNSKKIELKEKVNDILEPNNVSNTINNTGNNKLVKSYYNNTNNNYFNTKTKISLIKRRNKDNLDIDKMNSKENNSSRHALGNIYKRCIKELETLRLYKEKESEKLERINDYNSKKCKSLKSHIFKNKDKVMKAFLTENIKELNEDKNNKEEKIMRDFIQLKLKKDPIIKLSEKFAYANRIPLLTLFNYDEKKKKIKNGPLAKLKIKDKKIMKKLEDDNRNTKLLMKRLDEDQEKYTSGGYFFMSKDQDNTNKRNKYKKSLYSDLENAYSSGFNFSNLKGFDSFEN